MTFNSAPKTPNAFPLIIGHRGVRKYAPENTISSFKKAIELKLDGVEFDVCPTADHVPVVIHDDNLSRLTGKHLHVSKLTFDQLKQMDIGNKFDEYYLGEKVPSLKETLDLFATTNFIINIELKSHHKLHKIFLENLIRTVEESKIGMNRIMISSFSREILYQLGRLAPHFFRSLLLRPAAFFFLDVIFSASMLRVSGLNPHISITNELMMHYARVRNWKVFVWTANSPEQVKKAVKLKVDGIITDDPLLVYEVLKEVSYGR